MTRRERMMATLQGRTVDRPALNFYEINGLDENPNDPDPFNIYSDPSWLPLIQLARDKTDRIVMRCPEFADAVPDPLAGLGATETHIRNGTRYTVTTIRAGARTLTRRTRRDPEINTIWEEEHLLKNVDDLKAFLEIPLPPAGTRPRLAPVLEAEKQLGDSGIVMFSTADPLCFAAAMFDMAEFTVIAMTEPALFHRLLQKFAARLLPQTAAMAQAAPGRLWRICGPEYASPPFLPPALFAEYVVRYDTPMVDSIHRSGGFARIHCHGRLRDILGQIAATGCVALDPIEPPPQGDVDLAQVRRRVGQQMVLFGNLEASDLENLPTTDFEKKIDQALRAGTAGPGRGFVLMPSACPYGRKLSPLALRNYEKMIERIERI